MSRLSGLRRGAARSGGGSKGKNKGGFYAKWTPPAWDGDHGTAKKLSNQLPPHELQQVMASEVQAAEPIVLVPGEYPDASNPDPVTGQPTVGEMYTRKSHRYQRFYKGKAAGYRQLTCTRGPDPHNPQPCVACLLIDRKEMDEKASGARDTWIVNLAHLGAYFETQYVKDGQPQSRDGKPTMIKKACKQSSISDKAYWTDRAAKDRNASAQCEGCAQGIPHVLGEHRYWELGKGHLNALLDFNDKVLSNICYYTGTGIVQKGFACGSCHNPIMDIATSQFSNDQVKQYGSTPQSCPHCGAHGMPVADYESGYDSNFISKVAGYQPPVDGAGNPVPVRPLDIFDVVLWIQREGEGTKSAPTVKKWARITQAPFGEGGAEVDLTSTVEALVPKVFDFEDLFSTTTEQQAKDLDRANPYAQQQQQYAGYPAPTGVPGATPSVPPPAPPQHGYAPPQAMPPAAAYPPPGVPATAPTPAAAPVAAPQAPAYPAAPPAAPMAAPPAAAPTAAPAPAPVPVAAPPSLPTPVAVPGQQAAPPAAPAPIAAPYPQAPQVGQPAAPAAGGPPQPGNRPDWGGNQ